jgi:hypothetical protein
MSQIVAQKNQHVENFVRIFKEYFLTIYLPLEIFFGIYCILEIIVSDLFTTSNIY